MTSQSKVSEITTQDSKVKESGLKHGQFKVKMQNADKQSVEVIVNPPTQEDYAEGWNLVLPREHKNSTTHHFSVYLSQLPPHLWHAVRTVYDEDGSEQYAKIFDNIYHYTVKQAKTDSDVFALYNLVTKQHSYLYQEQISKLYKQLEQQRVKGWVMLRAKSIMNQ